jgi:predicted TIM-barrel enzyme
VTTTWLDEVFNTTKPVIAMLHLAALPGDPGYDGAAGISAVVARAREELDALQSGGVDGVMISNEFSLPYLTKTEPITAITMARIIGELLPELQVPYGVNVLWDGRASIDLAVATGAKFVREIFTGVYASDFGLWNTNLADRDLASITRTTVFATLPDAICVSGATAGSPTDVDALRTVKSAAGAVPVFVNTGVRAENVAAQLDIADGAIVGTYFKRDGVFENRAERSRVEELMSEARKFREQLV